jgi:6-methylsalicylate decarboxylase
VPGVDVHQHLWPDAFVAALRSRTRPPRLDGSALELVEGRFEIDLARDEPEARLALLDRAELDVAVVSLQPTLGLELLPETERAELAAVWEEGIRELGHVSGGRIAGLAAGGELNGFAGACVGAGALADLETAAPLLDELERRRAFLFVHPGAAAPPPIGAPDWWTRTVDYTAQMQGAFFAWLSSGRERWPGLAVVFAILAGGAPFQLERLAQRGVGVRSTLDPNTYLDTATYGRRALELCLETFGVHQLVYGSDVPVVDPAPTLRAVRGFGHSVHQIVTADNPTRLLT